MLFSIENDHRLVLKTKIMKTIARLNGWPPALAVGILLTGCSSLHAMDATQGGALPGPLPIFPQNNWNLDISSWPLDPNSQNYINFINNGSVRHLHPDFGGN